MIEELEKIKWYELDIEQVKNDRNNLESLVNFLMEDYKGSYRIPKGNLKTGEQK